MDHVPLEHQHDADDAIRHGFLTTRKRTLLATLAVLGVLGFLALGAWQVERRGWKQDLLARVDARIHAVPGSLPQFGAAGPATAYEYRRVRASGTYQQDADTLTQAVTEHGAGFWVLTPLVTEQGTVLVNRGFVPSDQRRSPKIRAPAGKVTVIGLLRASEPRGGFLRANDPAANRWHSRDVAAIARAHRLGPVAPYFIDAEGPNTGGYPLPGLTVVRFPDNHLGYALTWFALAGLCAFAAVRVLRDKP